MRGDSGITIVVSPPVEGSTRAWTRRRLGITSPDLRRSDQRYGLLADTSRLVAFLTATARSCALFRLPTLPTLPQQ